MLSALGVAGVIAAFVLWLVPTPHNTTTVAESSTTAVTPSSGKSSTTTVRKTTTTTAPGAARSDAMLVAMLTFGVGLVVAAGVWDRLQEFAIGGVSIKLTEAVVDTPGVALSDAAVAEAAQPSSTAFQTIAGDVESIARRRLGLVRIDLKDGEFWAPLNLKLYVLLLANRSNAEVIVFTGDGIAGERTYLGSVSVAQLAVKVGADDPVLAIAERSTATLPLTGDPQYQLGTTIDAKLRELPRAAEPANERVDAPGLHTLAGPTLIAESVEYEGDRIMSKEQQRSILVFPLSYVAITVRGRLTDVVDKRRLADKIALSTV
jgi:hypothetical protein